MAKRAPKRKAPTKAEADAGTTTYSTRLSPEQRKLLDQAAALTDVTPSKFIRDAAIRAAIDVVNAAPPQDGAIAQMAERVVKLTTDARFTVRYVDAFREMFSYDHGAASGAIGFFDGGTGSDQMTAESVEVDRLKAFEGASLVAMLKTCPAALCGAMLSALSKPESAVRYEPRVDPASLGE